MVSDEMRKYFAIRVCTGYYKVGQSPLPLYYELLLLVNQACAGHMSVCAWFIEITFVQTSLYLFLVCVYAPKAIDSHSREIKPK